jgi:phosphoribosyl 1,2-cyclic phosphate phosphodiesterase
MRLTLVGTGTSGGVPMIGCACPVCTSDDPKDHRLRSAAFIDTDDGRRVAIDCGPDFRQQMLREGADDLDAILFTHEHRDHTAGLDDVRAINFLRRKPIAVYATARVLASLREQFAYIFQPTDYGGLPQLTFHEIDGETPFEAAGLTVTPIPVWHARMPVLGFRVGGMAYVTDTNRIPDHSLERLRGVELLVLDALRRERHVSHFSLDEALAVVAELAPAETLLTHVSHQMGRAAEVDPTLPEGVRLGFDGVKRYF